MCPRGPTTVTPSGRGHRPSLLPPHINARAPLFFPSAFLCAPLLPRCAFLLDPALLPDPRCPKGLRCPSQSPLTPHTKPLRAIPALAPHRAIPMPPPHAMLGARSLPFRLAAPLRQSGPVRQPFCGDPQGSRGELSRSPHAFSLCTQAVLIFLNAGIYRSPHPQCSWYLPHSARCLALRSASRAPVVVTPWFCGAFGAWSCPVSPS